MIYNNMFSPIKSPEHLVEMCKKHDLEIYIHFKDIWDKGKFPILNYFKNKKGFLSSLEVNKLLKKRLLPYQVPMSSYVMNIILNELTKAGYDIFKELEKTN